jgi:transcriptional regulator with XRE-family HTH domain
MTTTTRKFAKQVIGSCIRALRQQAGLTLEQLAGRAGLSYQYLSGIETGKENFSINVLERVADALGFPLPTLIDNAYRDDDGRQAPRIDVRHLRSGVPLPEGLPASSLEAIVNQAQLMLFQINRSVRSVAGRALHDMLRNGNFREIAADVLCTSLSKHSPFQPVPDTTYRLVAAGRGGRSVKLEVDARHAGDIHTHGSGQHVWHLAARYDVDGRGDICFMHLMLAELKGHDGSEADWRKVAAARGVTEHRYEATPSAITKLLDGSLLLVSAPPSQWKQLEHRRPGEAPPPWSIFARNPATLR